MQLSEDDQAFRARAPRFPALRRDRRGDPPGDRETGENFDEGVHLALGAEGYLAARLSNAGSDDGFSVVRRRIWELEVGRAHAPWFHWPTTSMVAHVDAVRFARTATTTCFPGC